MRLHAFVTESTQTNIKNKQGKRKTRKEQEKSARVHHSFTQHSSITVTGEDIEKESELSLTLLTNQQQKLAPKQTI